MVSKMELLALTAVLAMISGAQGRILLQGTNNTSTAVLRWAVPENGVIDAVRVTLGGSVTFSWTQLHDVWEISSAQCPSSFANSSSVRQIAQRSTGGSATVNFNDTRVRYFACSVSDHCQEGQLVAIRVNGAEAPSPARAPGPARTSGAAGYSGNSSPGYAGGSSGNYGNSNSSSTTSAYGSDGVNKTPGYGGGCGDEYGSGK